MYQPDSRNGELRVAPASFAERRVRELLLPTGIEINGTNPWDLQVYNRDFFRRVLVQGSLGLGESYVEKWWETERLDEFFARLLSTPVTQDHRFVSHVLAWARAKLVNQQSRRRAYHVAEAHYDLGNDIYEAMLDRRMVYTCAYWATAADLDEAQEHKLDLVCRKIGLRRGMTVLDIGCGWGSFARFAAERYGAHVTGLTVSREQVELGQRLCQGLPVELRLQDYRDVEGNFDAVVSLGMFEHVGHKNYRTYMEVAKRCLKDSGLFLLHTIGKNDSRPGVDPWVAKYIFPNGEIPSLKQIAAACENLLVIEDVHNFGPDYDKTLMAWFRNFHKHWPKLRERHGERFYRIWKYYLNSCAGAFRARDLQLWQFVISHGSNEGAYRRPA